jgi:hypothetical protein
MLIRAAMLAFAMLALGHAAQAACKVETPPDFSTHPRMDTMTSDQVNIKGGCIDNTPIGQNQPAAGNFSTLTINNNPTISTADVPTCSDDSGQHLNFNGTSFVCGTSGAPVDMLTADDGSTILTADDGATALFNR